MPITVTISSRCRFREWPRRTTSHTWVDILAEPTGTPGLAVNYRASGFTGVVVRGERDGVVVRGVTGLERNIRLTAGAFTVAGRAVTVVPPAPPPKETPYE